MLEDEYYKKCIRNEEGTCQGRITLEHALIFAGKQVNEKFAILPVCAFHHAVDQFQDGGDINKEYHVWVALNRATESELRSISKAVNYVKLKATLNAKYGIYN